MFFSI